jgi:RNA polymerase sigma-70 factor (ECF subfamily)
MLMNDVDDTALIERIAQARDHDAFAELYRRHVQVAHNVALHVTGNSATAEDALQEGMLRVWRSASTFKTGNVRAWIFRIVARESIRMMKQKRSSEARENREDAAVLNEQPAPSAGLEHDEQISVLNGALRGLPKLERQLVALHFVAEMSQREIGEALEIPNQTISYRVNKALESLRSHLAQAGFASLVPMVGAELLYEAMTKEASLPSAASEKMLQRIRLSGISARNLSRRVAATKSTSAFLAAGLIVLAGATGAGIWFSQQNRPAASPPVTAQQTVRKVDETPELNWRWTFEKGPPAEVVVREGVWNWNAGLQQMNSEALVRLQLPSPVPHKAMVIQCSISYGGGANPKCGTMWSDGTKLLGCRICRPTSTSIRIGQKGDHRIYVVGPRIYGFMDGRLTAVAEYATPYPAERLVLGISNLGVNELIFREVKESELPTEVREDPNALIERLGWPCINASEQLLPPEK